MTEGTCCSFRFYRHINIACALLSCRFLMHIITSSYYHVTADVFPVEHISFWPCYSVCSLRSVISNNRYTMRFLLQMRLQTLLWCIGSVITLLLLIQLLIPVCVCVCVCVYIYIYVCDNPVHAVAKMCNKQHTLLLWTPPLCS
jgi:hypothetical protein